jgi:hypothetical protein
VNDWKATSRELGGVCRATVFKLWKSGDLPSVTIGSRRFSTDAQITDYIHRLEAESAAGGPTTQGAA